MTIRLVFISRFGHEELGSDRDVVAVNTATQRGVGIDGFEVDSGNSSRVSSTIHQHSPLAVSNRSHHTMGTTEWFTWVTNGCPASEFLWQREYVATIYQGLYAAELVADGLGGWAYG